MPRPWYRRLPTLLRILINQCIKRSTVQYFNTTALKTSRTTVRASCLYGKFLYILFLIVCKKIACHLVFSCIKAIGFEYFKLARSVLNIGSFEFINLQYFNSTFMKVSFECKRQHSRVHVVFTSVIAL